MKFVPTWKHHLITAGVTLAIVFVMQAAHSQSAGGPTMPALDRSTAIQIGGGVAFWDPDKHRLYIYGNGFNECTGVYEISKLGTPMVRINN